MRIEGRKSDRLLKIEALLLDYPEGLSQAEIARRLGVHRSTITRYISDLPGHIYVDDLDGNRWKIDRAAYLVPVRLNLHEAMSVHLAARLLATRLDRQNQHAARALRKISLGLERLAPQVSLHLRRSADELDGSSRRPDPLYLQVLETLTLAWAERRKVRLWRYSEGEPGMEDDTGSQHEFTFEPYFIEPGAVGMSTYVFGWRTPPGALRTFKMERITRAELLRERYEIPAGFDERSLLRDAWGIWFTGEPPVEVRLRFSARIARRVLETRWHRSERVQSLPNGGLLWQAHIAQPVEMLPWIRGWGAEVEVLAPGSLRQALEDESRRLAAVYGAG